MEDIGRADRWANRFAWLMVALIGWTANWWISLFVPVAPVAFFATTMILVSLMYALVLAGMNRVLRKDIETWTVLPRLVRDNVAAGLAVLIATLVSAQNVIHHKSASFQLTSAAATFIGLLMATWWRVIFRTARRRAARAAAEFVSSLRGHPN